MPRRKDSISTLLLYKAANPLVEAGEEGLEAANKALSGAGKAEEALSGANKALEGGEAAAHGLPAPVPTAPAVSTATKAVLPKKTSYLSKLWPQAKQVGGAAMRIGGPTLGGHFADNALNDPATQKYMDEHGLPSLAAFGRWKSQNGVLGQNALMGAGLGIGGGSYLATEGIPGLKGTSLHEIGNEIVRDAEGNIIKSTKLPGVLPRLARTGEAAAHVAPLAYDAATLSTTFPAERVAGRQEQHDTDEADANAAVDKLIHDTNKPNASTADTKPTTDTKPTNAAPVTDKTPNAAAPGMFDNIPNWGKGLAIGAAGLGGGYLADQLMRPKKDKDDEDEDEGGSMLPGVGTVAGLGAAGVGLGAMSGWDINKLKDPKWWQSKITNHVPLSIVKLSASVLTPSIPAMPNADGLKPNILKPPAPVLPPAPTPSAGHMPLAGEASWPKPQNNEPNIHPSGPYIPNAEDRVGAYNAGHNVPLAEGDENRLTPDRMNALVNDPAQQAQTWEQGKPGEQPPAGIKPFLSPPGTAASRPPGAPVMTSATPKAGPPAGTPAGTPKGGPTPGDMPGKGLGDTTGPQSTMHVASTKILAQQFNGDPNKAQMAAWEKLKASAPPNPPGGLTGWLTNMWNELGKIGPTPMGISMGQILLAGGLTIGAIGLMSSMGGMAGGQGPGLMGPLLGIGGLGLAGYMAYNHSGNTAGDESGGLNLSSGNPTAAGLRQQMAAGKLPEDPQAREQMLANMAPTEQANARRMFNNSPMLEKDLQGASLYRGQALGLNSQQPTTPEAPVSGSAPAGNAPPSADIQFLLRDPPYSKYFDPATGAPDINKIMQLLNGDGKELQGLADKLAVEHPAALDALIKKVNNYQPNMLTSLLGGQQIIQIKAKLLQVAQAAKANAAQQQQQPAAGVAGAGNPNSAAPAIPGEAAEYIKNLDHASQHYVPEDFNQLQAVLTDMTPEARAAVKAHIARNIGDPNKTGPADQMYVSGQKAILNRIDVLDHLDQMNGPDDMSKLYALPGEQRINVMRYLDEQAHPTSGQPAWNYRPDSPERRSLYSGIVEKDKPYLSLADKLDQQNPQSLRNQWSQATDKGWRDMDNAFGHMPPKDTTGAGKWTPEQRTAYQHYVGLREYNDKVRKLQEAATAPNVTPEMAAKYEQEAQALMRAYHSTQENAAEQEAEEDKRKEMQGLPSGPFTEQW